MLTEDERIFFERARPFIEQGMTLREACKAVIDRDMELYIALTGHDGKPLREAITETVYKRLRS